VKRTARRWGITVLLLLLAAQGAMAIEFRPFPEAQVTIEQWQAYHDAVRGSFAASEKRFPELNLVTYDDAPHGAAYAFTEPAHPAHPAWIARRVIEKDGQYAIEQIGYFAGAEAPFAALFEEYRALNDKIRDELNRDQ
jgi:hypothetical protein